MGRAHNHSRFCSVSQIPFAEEIRRCVEEFASGHQLVSQSYYHDLPVWIIHEPEGGDITRRIQITAYLVASDLFLSLVPSVRISVDAETYLVPKHVTVERFPIARIIANHHVDAKAFRLILEETWVKATQTTQYNSTFAEVKARPPVTISSTRFSHQEP
jgi:hypothetical protein